MTEGKQDFPTTVNQPTKGLPQVFRPQLVGIAAGVLAGALLITGIVVVAPLVGGPSCEQARAPIRIVAVPELTDVVTKATAGLDAGTVGACALRVTVSAEDPAVTAANLANERGDRPDVWIPDSSVWTLRATKPGTGVPSGNASVASSPVVLAMASSVAAQAGNGTILRLDAFIPPDAETDPTLRWVLREPEESAATVGALIELQQAVAGKDEAAARYGSVVRTSTHSDLRPVDLPARAAVALPMSEQQLFGYNRAHPDRRLAGAYARSGFRFDYPYVVLTGERARRDRATQVLDALKSDSGRSLLAAAGFRGTDGVAGAPLTAELGKAVNGFAEDPVADGRQVNAAIRGYTSVLRPTQLLAVLDVSGSMATPVPGANGTTRLDLAVRASTTGLAVYPDDTLVGVWAFSTKMNGNLDYKVMAPLQELGRGLDGTPGRAHIASALARIQITKGHTGLNDTVLAAVREVRSKWDPKRVNSVVVITDGGNSDPDGIATRRLLRTLQAENDPDRPVAVFAIAYGPSSDFRSLQKISAVTGGRAYAAPDPRQIGQVLADAIGRRSCAPAC